MKKKAFVLMAALLLVLTWRPGNAAAQKSMAENLVGVWESQAESPWGMSYSRAILLPDGTFTKTFRAGQLFTWDRGWYTVGRDYIHFTIVDHEPKFYLGRPMHWVESETIFFRFVGPDTIACEDRLAGARWTARRVR